MLTKFLNFYTKYFAFWVVIFGLLAYVVPAPFVSLKPAMDWFFALTMFGIGAILEADDFKAIIRQPVLVLIGCCAQFTIMPLCAFAAAKVLSLPPELAVGLILTGAAPDAHGEVSIEVSAPDPHFRSVCWSATTRGPAREDER